MCNVINFKYYIREDSTCVDGESFSSYGIEVREQTKSEPDKPIRTIRDITLSPDKLKALIELMNRCELSPIHLDDVLEDFIFS